MSRNTLGRCGRGTKKPSTIRRDELMAADPTCCRCGATLAKGKKSIRPEYDKRPRLFRGQLACKRCPIVSND